jgi:hypothetical protein
MLGRNIVLPFHSFETIVPRASSDPCDDLILNKSFGSLGRGGRAEVHAYQILVFQVQGPCCERTGSVSFELSIACPQAFKSHKKISAKADMINPSKPVL